MITNSRMRPLIQRDGALAFGHALSDDAVAILDAGWMVGPEKALVLAALVEADRQPDISPSAVGEYEYHANDVYISLTDLRRDMKSYLANAAARGLGFAAEMLRAAAGLPNAAALCAVVSVFVDMEHEDFLLQGVTIRFTTRRGGYPEWLGDLERFESEAIAVLEMADAATA